jgi:hypothetical protein
MSDLVPEKKVGPRAKNGTFAPGWRGGGRPKGSRNRAKVRAEIKQGLEDISRDIVDRYAEIAQPRTVLLESLIADTERLLGHMKTLSPEQERYILRRLYELLAPSPETVVKVGRCALEYTLGRPGVVEEADDSVDLKGWLQTLPKPAGSRGKT